MHRKALAQYGGQEEPMPLVPEWPNGGVTLEPVTITPDHEVGLIWGYRRYRVYNWDLRAGVVTCYRQLDEEDES